MSVVSGRNFFYEKVTVSDTDFPSIAQVKIPFQANHVIITNDSLEVDVLFSFLFPSIDGELFQKETPIVFDGVSVSKVWFKRTTGADAQVRVWAWRK